MIECAKLYRIVLWASCPTLYRSTFDNLSVHSFQGCFPLCCSPFHSLILQFVLIRLVSIFVLAFIPSLHHPLTFSTASSSCYSSCFIDVVRLYRNSFAFRVVRYSFGFAVLETPHTFPFLSDVRQGFSGSNWPVQLLAVLPGTRRRKRQIPPMCFSG